MIKISITSQKGGVGKSVITTVLANRLSFQKRYKILIVDCDIPQFSILSNFRTEKKLFNTIKEKKVNGIELEILEKQWVKEFEFSTGPEKNTIEILSINDDQIKGSFQKIDQFSTNYDIIIYDLPGTLKEIKLLNEMLRFDYVFVPLEPVIASGSKSLSTAAGLSLLKDKFQGHQEIKLRDIFLFFNKVNPCSKQHRLAMSQLYTTAAKRGFKFIEKPDKRPAYIDSKVLYQSVLCTSLFFDTSRLLRYTKIEAVIQDMIKIIQNEIEE